MMDTPPYPRDVDVIQRYKPENVISIVSAANKELKAQSIHSGGTS
jgi:hypothetical protein